MKKFLNSRFWVYACGYVRVVFLGELFLYEGYCGEQVSTVCLISSAVEHVTFNHRVRGSNPLLGSLFDFIFLIFFKFQNHFLKIFFSVRIWKSSRSQQIHSKLIPEIPEFSKHNFCLHKFCALDGASVKKGDNFVVLVFDSARFRQTLAFCSSELAFLVLDFKNL